MKKWFATMFAVSALAACSGGDGDDNGPEFEKPQIWPEVTPACLTTIDIVVGDSVKYDFGVSNRGEEPLIITGAEIVDDDDGHFRYEETRATVGSPPCTEAASCSLEYEESVFARFFYEPKSAGWHSANLLVYSNAENFPVFQTYVLARARPMESDPSYDFGAPPADADGACMP